jgi:predicted nucleic acid-binding protein
LAAVKTASVKTFSGSARACVSSSKAEAADGSVQVMRQVSRVEVPDMPDRMVAATAVYFDVPVISRDRRIRAASLKTIW